MKWIKALPESALSENERQVVDIQDHKILLIRQKGVVYAMLNACPHMGASLKRGKVTENHSIVCPLHHSAFSMETGEIAEWSPWPPVVGKVMGRMKQERPLRVFPTKEEEGTIWIGLQDD